MAIATINILSALGVLTTLVVCTDAVSFGYSGSNGPDKWGSLNPDWKICNSGSKQSPINIVKDDLKADPSLEALKRDYADGKATLVNNGFNVQLRYDESVGNVLVEGRSYSLLQMHWHSPSEHTLDGERFPFELHLVHKSQDGQLAVVAILYQLGHTDTFLNQLQECLKELGEEKCGEDQETQIPVGVVENKAMKRASRKYYRYVGSLTAPPCTENVTWTILGKVREMSSEQAAALKAPLSGEYRNNSRPTQALNGRSVRLYLETTDKDGGDNSSDTD